MAKRLFDFFSALMGLVLLSPLFLGVALLIKLEDRPEFDSSGPFSRHSEN